MKKQNNTREIVVLSGNAAWTTEPIRKEWHSPAGFAVPAGCADVVLRNVVNLTFGTADLATGPVLVVVTMSVMSPLQIKQVQNCYSTSLQNARSIIVEPLSVDCTVHHV